MGVTREDYGSGDTARIARRVSESGAASAMLGSATAADALRNANAPPSWNTPSAGNAQVAAALKVGFEGLETKLGAGSYNLLGGDVRWSWHEGMHAGPGAEQREIDAAKKKRPTKKRPLTSRAWNKPPR